MICCGKQPTIESAGHGNCSRWVHRRKVLNLTRIASQIIQIDASRPVMSINEPAVELLITKDDARCPPLRTRPVTIDRSFRERPGILQQRTQTAPIQRLCGRGAVGYGCHRALSEIVEERRKDVHQMHRHIDV